MVPNTEKKKSNYILTSSYSINLFHAHSFNFWTHTNQGYLSQGYQGVSSMIKSVDLYSVIASITFGDLPLFSIFTLLCSSPNDVIFFSTATSLNKDHYMCEKHYQHDTSLIQITVEDFLLSGSSISFADPKPEASKV